MSELALTILPETAADEAAVERLHERTFGPGRFARTAFRIREGRKHMLDLSFTARVGTLMIGSVRLTPICIGDTPALLLGPLTIEPPFRSHGVGTALIKRALMTLQEHKTRRSRRKQMKRKYREDDDVDTAMRRGASTHLARVHDGTGDSGLAMLEPQSFSRPVTIDGVEHLARFRTVRTAPELFEAGRVYYCQHYTPELVWHRPWMSHPNGVLGLSELVIVTSNLEIDLPRYAKASPNSAATTCSSFWRWPGCLPRSCRVLRASAPPSPWLCHF